MRPTKEKVLVGLSGGVDSAACARLLLQKGYEVVGCYLSFCEGSSPDRAARVAEKLGIPLVVASYEREFRRRVILPFVASYREAKTPNPCVECNRKMKIRALLGEADRLGIRLVATGHYARVEKRDGRFCLVRAEDEKKDQSYFLWKLEQRQLARLMFPLSSMEKKDIKSLAADLVCQKEKESMEICFIPDGDTARFLKENGGETPAGDFVDKTGRVLGRHGGVSLYTVGQRRGLGVAAGERVFVTSLDAKENRVVLGSAEELLTDSIEVGGIHWVSCTKRTLGRYGQISVRTRHRGALMPCRLVWEGKRLRVLLDAPTRRVAAGQSACFYADGTLLFGGEVLG